VLLQRTPDWYPWLGPTVFLGALVLSAALLVEPWMVGRTGRLVAAAAVVVGIAGSASYAFATAATPHAGAIPTAGPAQTVTFGRGGAGGPFGRGAPGGRFGAVPPGAGNRGAAGGLLSGSNPSTELTNVLETNADQYTWVAATVGSNSASGYQLATGDPVMSIGGFNGTDPTPTLAQFQAYVESGQIHYFIAGGGFGGFGGGFGRGGFGTGGAASTSSQISSWVEQHFTARTVGGVTIYDLTAA
jgi:hypothetical protein